MKSPYKNKNLLPKEGTERDYDNPNYRVNLSTVNSIKSKTVKHVNTFLPSVRMRLGCVMITLPPFSEMDPGFIEKMPKDNIVPFRTVTKVRLSWAIGYDCGPDGLDFYGKNIGLSEKDGFNRYITMKYWIEGTKRLAVTVRDCHADKELPRWIEGVSRVVQLFIYKSATCPWKATCFINGQYKLPTLDVLVDRSPHDFKEPGVHYIARIIIGHDPWAVLADYHKFLGIDPVDIPPVTAPQA